MALWHVFKTFEKIYNAPSKFYPKALCDTDVEKKEKMKKKAIGICM